MCKLIKIVNLVFNSFTNDSRVKRITKSLASNEYKVEILAHLDNSLKKEEIQDNYKIRRLVYLNRKITKSKLIKLKAYFLWIKESIKYIKNSDIIHCNDLNTLPIGVIIKKFFNKKVKIVYDAHEYEINDKPNESKISIKIKYFLEKFLIKYADKVITVSDSIANEYVRLHRIEKPAVVLNTPPYKEIEKKDLFRKELGIGKDKVIFLYQGGLSSGRGIEILLETFKTIENKDTVIVFMGYGPLEDLIKEYSKKYDNIYFHAAVSPDILLDYTSSADFGISMIEDSCLSYRYCLPNKMFEYIMAEIPVVVSNLYEMRRLVKNYNIGIVAEENNVKGLKEAIKKALKVDRKIFEENIKRVKKIFNWQEQEKILLSVYKELEK